MMKLLHQDIILDGTLAYEPELRYTPGGHAVMTAVVNTVNHGACVCNAWNEVAEGIIEKDYKELTRVHWHGDFKTRGYVNQDGEPRTIVYFNVDKDMTDG